MLGSCLLHPSEGFAVRITRGGNSDSEALAFCAHLPEGARASHARSHAGISLKLILEIWGEITLEPTWGQMDDSFSQLLNTYYLPQVVSVGD